MGNQTSAEVNTAQAVHTPTPWLVHPELTAAIRTHIAKLSAEAREDFAANRIDEVMTDALYRDCGADTKNEMAEALALAISICAGEAK